MAIWTVLLTMAVSGIISVVIWTLKDYIKKIFLVG
jgi:hypothetical protein